MRPWEEAGGTGAGAGAGGLPAGQAEACGASAWVPSAPAATHCPPGCAPGWPACSAPRGNSTYVTASRNMSEDGGASGEGSRPASRASAGSPRSRSPSPGSQLSRASSSLSRQLNVPWALPRAGSGRRADPAAGAAGQHAQHAQHAVGQLASLLEAAGLEGAEQGAAASYAGMSEEEALQRALELSLQDARQQARQQQREAAEEAAADDDAAGAEATPGPQQPQQLQQASAQAAAAAPLVAEPVDAHVRHDAASAVSMGDGKCGPLRGGGADVPATE